MISPIKNKTYKNENCIERLTNYLQTYYNLEGNKFFLYYFHFCLYIQIKTFFIKNYLYKYIMCHIFLITASIISIIKYY